MTIHSDDLVRASGHIIGLGASVLAAYDAVAGSGSAFFGLPLVCCGMTLVYTAGSFQDSLRRRDTRVVACLANNPGMPIPEISAATGLHEERVASSLQRLVADGLVASEAGPPLAARSYRLAL
ncbi:winged helix-turn-helix transcriptional regulator [Streptomyces sp. NPDC127092]|uniref:winged helix-turn-helix transcriptional regulator n=1 Tax=Streptomyces sp. NPDC127092 TaxID=3347135 RepID=UPI003662F637